MDIRDSTREMIRKDFSIEFLRDFADTLTENGHDPYNYVGMHCGINGPRALQIWQDRIPTLQVCGLMSRQAS